MSTIANTQALMGYQRANQRSACGNCVHGTDDWERDRPAWRCAKGSFITSALAVCAQHQPRPKAGT